MFGFACLLITLIFIGAVLAHKLIFSFALSALSGVPRWMLHSRRRSRGTQMFRNMMRRKGTSYPGQRRDDGGEEAQEHVADDIEEAPPKPPAVEDSAKRVGHEVNMPDDTEEVPPEPPTDRDSVQRAGDDGEVEGSNVTYMREGDENPTPTEPPTFQARFRFTSSEREIDGDNIMSQNDGATNERAPSLEENKGQPESQSQDERAFDVREKNEPTGNQSSRIERSISSGGTSVEPGAQTSKEDGSTTKANQDEKVPLYREETVSHQRENDKQGGDKPQATLNETSGQTSVTPPKPRIRVRQERMPENLAEKQFNDERVPPPTDDS